MRNAVIAAIVAAIVAAGTGSAATISLMDRVQNQRLARLENHDRTQRVRLATLEQTTSEQTKRIAQLETGARFMENYVLVCLGTDTLGVVRTATPALDFSPDAAHDEFRVVLLNESCWH